MPLESVHSSDAVSAVTPALGVLVMIYCRVPQYKVPVVSPFARLTESLKAPTYYVTAPEATLTEVYMSFSELGAVKVAETQGSFTCIVNVIYFSVDGKPVI